MKLRPSFCFLAILMFSVTPAFGTSLLYAPSQPDDSTYRSAISTLTADTVDYFDPRASTPTLAALQLFDVVFTWANYSYSDNVAFGDVLADYVDNGGRVILGQWTAPTAGNYLAGRIMTAGYSPAYATAQGGSTTYSGDGTSVLFQGVGSFNVDYSDDIFLQGLGIADGTFTNGNVVLAYQPDFSVIYISGLMAPVYISGDYAQLIANAVNASSIPEPTTLALMGLGLAGIGWKRRKAA